MYIVRHNLVSLDQLEKTWGKRCLSLVVNRKFKSAKTWFALYRIKMGSSNYIKGCKNMYKFFYVFTSD